MEGLYARMIATPSDLREILEVTDGSRWVNLAGFKPEWEPEVRRALEAVFEPQRTRRFTGDRAGLFAYLESVTAPLAFLREGGVAIMALVTPSRALGMRFLPLAPDWALYLVGSPGMYVRCQAGSGGVVHRFDSGCGALLESYVQAVRDGQVFTTWATLADVTAALGAAIPWCTQCCLAEIAGAVPGAEA